jgi:hypothetical protein
MLPLPSLPDCYYAGLALNVVFTLELVARCWAEGLLTYIAQGWNLLDVVVVVAGYVGMDSGTSGGRRICCCRLMLLCWALQLSCILVTLSYGRHQCCNCRMLYGALEWEFVSKGWRRG